MASLTVRGIDEAIKARLRVRAALNGRSTEAEVRAILAAAVAESGPEARLGSRITELFAGLGPLDVPPRVDTPRAVDFS